MMMLAVGIMAMMMVMMLVVVMVVIMVVMTALAPLLVLAQVLPSDVGRHQAPWFFLLPSYWRRRQRDDVGEKLLDQLLTTTTADKGVAVAISDLRKSYPGATGVKQARTSRNKGASCPQSVAWRQHGHCNEAAKRPASVSDSRRRG